VTPIHLDNTANLDNSPFAASSLYEREILDEKTFQRMVAIERKRTERTQEPFLLMLLEMGNHQATENDEAPLITMASALLSSSRETDIIGWYKDQSIVGVLFTGLVVKDKNLILSTILSRVKAMLHDELRFDKFNQISISFHFFPDEWEQASSGRPSNPTLYPDLMTPDKRKRSLLVVKRSIDIVVSALLLALCSPLLLLIALAIKLTSKGPVLFRQQRVGQYGEHFTFLKFRSMHIGNDHNVHKAFITKMIAGAEQPPSSESGQHVYKLTNDKRITPVGNFLRRTSLDELPQLLNVLKGDMSLVGPRPAIPYELAAYQTWHRRRVLEAKPGITGLWQVAGRSRVRFDEMVRMDLRYASAWSPWLDIKILLRTPLAVIRGTGAY
jgi:lipopolysaccharide/colanic/teichoic acid biosynthesis glycosyltransferase